MGRHNAVSSPFSLAKTENTRLGVIHSHRKMLLHTVLGRILGKQWFLLAGSTFFQLLQAWCWLWRWWFQWTWSCCICCYWWFRWLCRSNSILQLQVVGCGVSIRKEASSGGEAERQEGRGEAICGGMPSVTLFTSRMCSWLWLKIEFSPHSLSDLHAVMYIYFGGRWDAR